IGSVFSETQAQTCCHRDRHRYFRDPLAVAFQPRVDTQSGNELHEQHAFRWSCDHELPRCIQTLPVTRFRWAQLAYSMPSIRDGIPNVLRVSI
ncbi:hypothetical protein, partial [Roseiconus lacunae]|uniref:hypothetical protein n=1 Tax=Roseiconus lacunae TaxID=2605694 RepID=UPI002AA562DD